MTSWLPKAQDVRADSSCSAATGYQEGFAQAFPDFGFWSTRWHQRCERVMRQEAMGAGVWCQVPMNRNHILYIIHLTQSAYWPRAGVYRKHLEIASRWDMMNMVICSSLPRYQSCFHTPYTGQVDRQDPVPLVPTKTTSTAAYVAVAVKVSLLSVWNAKLIITDGWLAAF
jgi:hypothetical protein